jgi:hypothetical protein
LAGRRLSGALDSVVTDAANEFRKLHIVRLEALLGAVWDAPTKGQLGAVDRALKLLDRHAKMLGLDLPQHPMDDI